MQESLQRQYNYRGDYLIRYIKDRVYRKNKNLLMIFTGETGSGKSYSALRLAEQINQNFTVDNVVFTVEDFIDAVDTARKGDVILFDELGIGAYRRNWYTMQNKALNYVAQLFRFKNLIVLSTSPFKKLVDTGLISLYHLQAETVKIFPEKQLCECKIFRLQYNEVMDKMYRHYLKVRTQNGVFALSRFYFKHPSKELAEKYEQKKKQYWKQIRDELRAEFEEKKNKKGGRINYDEIVDEVYKNYKVYLTKWGKRTIISYKDIAADFDISYHSAQKVKVKVERMLRKQGLL